MDLFYSCQLLQVDTSLPMTGQMWLRRSSLVAVHGDDWFETSDRLSLIMISGMYRLSAASPGVPSCEWALVAYMTLHANITSNTGSIRVGRPPLPQTFCESERKGSSPPLLGTRESASKPVRIRGGCEVVSMKSARNDPRASVTFD